MPEPSGRPLEHLVDQVVENAWGMPVRAMEAVLARGSEAVDPVAGALRRALDHRREAREGSGTGGLGEPPLEPPLEPLWPTVLLGEIGSPQGVPALAEVIQRAEPEDHSLREAAAEGLAKIGLPALESLRDLRATGEPDERLWAYAAAGWIRDDPAHGLLLEALETDEAMLDVVGSALAAHAREADIPRLHAALERAEPWMRLDLEDAIREIAQGDPRVHTHQEDWRLRYRLDPALGAIHPSWARVAALARSADVYRQRDPVPVRSLEEILAEPWTEDREPERCDCCGEVFFQSTGVEVCPDIAVSVAMIQHEILGQARRAGFRDLFDVMADAEEELWTLQEAPEPEDSRARRRHEDEETRETLLYRACRWLVEQGVEEIGAGRATLLAEAGRLADLHGDPEGLLSDGAGFRTEGPIQVPDTPGRNDPCPCGSGSKYKKCCGAPG